MGAARPVGAVSPEGKVLPAGRLLPGAARRCFARKARRRAGRSPGVSPPREYLPVQRPGARPFRLPDLRVNLGPEQQFSRFYARNRPEKEKLRLLFFLRKNKDVCAHTWFFENNCIVLRCAFGDRRPGFGKGSPAAGVRVRRGGVGPIRRIPQQAGFRAGVETTGTRCRRTETRTYSAKPD